jgi:NAD(P)-dependent dehydrogenase (short-subunit alcohol dehydrogenase family)
VYLPEEQVDAEKTKQLIVAAGQECLLIPQDIRDEQGCNRVIEQVVAAWGRIDILVNNASVMVSLLYPRPAVIGTDAYRSVRPDEHYRHHH